jgi:SAM-dependent methyltransferase
MKCRHCAAPLSLPFLDLGSMPPSNAYLSEEDLAKPERTYPLRVLACTQCWLVQTEDFVGRDELFRPDYAYFSSTSRTWLDHAGAYCSTITRKLGLSKISFVVEVASNDGYLLKNFVTAGIPCLGIEPTASTAAVAERTGIPVLREFFGEALAQRLAAQHKKADLVVGNNVYAHVPNINEFTRGIAVLLKPHGVVTLEFPHLLKLLTHSQFDTVYHEHFSYLSLHAVCTIFRAWGLKVWDVEELTTHGGSLRVYGALESSPIATAATVDKVLHEEREAGLAKDHVYRGFQARAEKIKKDLLGFLQDCKRESKKVAAYGAAAKGNTLLNFAGVKSDLLPFVCDAAPSKQMKFMPGSQIPIYPPDRLAAEAPDYVIILPWNIAEEVVAQNRALSAQGTRFVTCVPKLEVV